MPLTVPLIHTHADQLSPNQWTVVKNSLDIPPSNKKEHNSPHTFFTFCGDQPISYVSVILDECGVGPSTSARISNYICASPFKGGTLDFSVLGYLKDWCQTKGLKVIFWVHSKDPKEMNHYLIQHQNNPNHYTQSSLYQSFLFIPEWRFLDKEKEKSYFIYAKKLTTPFDWEPLSDSFIKHQRYHCE